MCASWYWTRVEIEKLGGPQMEPGTRHYSERLRQAMPTEVERGSASCGGLRPCGDRMALNLRRRCSASIFAACRLG
jgi:hypothetical protein